MDTSALSVPTVLSAPATTATSVSFDQGTPALPTPTITTTAPPSLEQMASATPGQVHPGDRVTITPGAAVQRNCADIVGVYDFNDVILGQVLGGDRWEPVSTGVGPTWPACLGATTETGMDVTVPPLPYGAYRLCLSVAVDFVGCASVFVADSTTPIPSPPVATGPVEYTSQGTDVQAMLLEPGQPQVFGLNTHCGVGLLSYRFNGQWWRTAEADDQAGWMPGEWYSLASLSGLLVELLLSADGNTLTVTYNGRSVEYAPTVLTTSDLCA